MDLVRSVPGKYDCEEKCSKGDDGKYIVDLKLLNKFCNFRSRGSVVIFDLKL